MAAVKDFKDLIVWQKSMRLALTLFELTKAFPDNEKFGMTGQIRRSAVSIPANIAEGNGRNSIPQYLNFLSIARGSLSELETLTILANKMKYISDTDFDTVSNQLTECAKMLNKLISALK